MRHGSAAGLSVLLVILAVAAVSAQPTSELRRERIGSPVGPPLTGSALDELTEEVSALMRCPVCQGLSVADSPTPLAAAMKNEVRDLLAAGYSPEQVMSYFEQSYGEFIRLAPYARGFNLTVWLAPLALLLFGVGLILRRRRSPSQRATLTTPDPDLEAYRAQVRREVGQ